MAEIGHVICCYSSGEHNHLVVVVGVVMVDVAVVMVVETMLRFASCHHVVVTKENRTTSITCSIFQFLIWILFMTRILS
jgi:hypothetical protein